MKALSSRRFVLVVFVLGLAGCADKANPVLPSSDISNPNGHVVGTSIVDSSVTADTSALTDALDAFDTNANLDGSLMVCDLLNPACPRKGDGCYPVAATGAGNCMPAGLSGPTVPCAPGENSLQPCEAGLACIGLASYGMQDECLYLCDTANPTKCAAGVVCQPLPGFAKATRVGYCAPF
jgi:hypothetical protein